MSTCKRCGKVYREPEDEQGDHPCPKCGYERMIYYICKRCGIKVNYDETVCGTPEDLLCEDCYLEKEDYIIELEERVKEFENAQQMTGMMLNNQQNQIEQAESRIKELEEKVKTLQDHANKLGEIITDQTKQRLVLEDKVKELEYGIALVVKIILTNSENVGIELHKILPKNCHKLRAIGFRFQSAIRSWYSESSRANEGWRKVEEAEARIKELESDLQLNASMLSKQCDLAREAETERDHLSRLLIEERVRTVKLRDAIGKHEKFIRSRNWVVSLEDEELYAYLKEVVEK